MKDFELDWKMKSYLNEAFRACRKRAKIKGFSFDINIDLIYKKFCLLDGHCCVSGIKFSLDPIKGSSRRPFLPSIDRIQNSKGYTPDNVRIVCNAVNMAKNDWDDDVLIKVAKAIVSFNERNPFYTALTLKGDTRIMMR